MQIWQQLLIILGEEGGEVAKDVCKALRFGLKDRNVLNPTGPTNRERIIDELNDLIAVVELLIRAGIIPQDWQDNAKKNAKKAKVVKFLRYAWEHGQIDATSRGLEKQLTSLLTKEEETFIIKRSFRALFMQDGKTRKTKVFPTVGEAIKAAHRTYMMRNNDVGPRDGYVVSVGFAQPGNKVLQFTRPFVYDRPFNRYTNRTGGESSSYVM